MLERKQQRLNNEANALAAMANLIVAFETEGLLGMIYKAMSNDWQVRLAHLAVYLFLVEQQGLSFG
jgi:hypothetical protein